MVSFSGGEGGTCRSCWGVVGSRGGTNSRGGHPQREMRREPGGIPGEWEGKSCSCPGGGSVCRGRQGGVRSRKPRADAGFCLLKGGLVYLQRLRGGETLEGRLGQARREAGCVGTQ